ncbi:MAG TPA: META domain-containing protein [Sphingomicrobium sp.]|nr:META domain-containing protein [Sphingomicrobium sp.]
MAAAVFRAASLALACAACTTIAADVRTFDGTRWHVTAIDGRATPATGDYHVEFKAGEISGRFGCNGWGGAYAVSGETMTASRVMSTMMACGDPAMTFESQGLAVLRQPMRLTWIAGRKLTLSNSAGSIALERVP